MIIKSRQFTGFTLTEMLVAMAIVVLVGSVSLFSIKALMDTYESSDNALALIDAALSNAKAIAVKEGRYAGVRFQREYDPDGFEKASQYMIFIVEDEATGLVNGYRAVDGRKPIKLPDSIMVLDTKYNAENSDPKDYVEESLLSLSIGQADTELADQRRLRDILTFSIIFSPSGKIVQKEYRVRNKDGKDYNETDSYDMIFNTDLNVMGINSNPIYGKFIQDDYLSLGLSRDKSVSSFVVVNREDFEEIPEDKRWSQFLQDESYTSTTALKEDCRVYINPYSGNLIIEEKE